MSQQSPPPAPNYAPIASAYKQSARFSNHLAQKQFKWAKQVYRENKGVTDKIVDEFMKTMTFNDDAARRDRLRYEKTFQPLEDDLAQEAQDYASPEKRAHEMGRAESAVGQQFQAARTAAARDLESFGVNPSATRFAALDIGVRAQEAASKAAAAEQAGQQVDATGRALRSEAINVGRGYPGQIAGTYNTGMQAGNGANNNQLATTASGANTMGTGYQWNAQANNALNGWGSVLHQGYGDQMAYYNASQQGSGLGTALGLIGGLGMKAMTFAADGGAIEGDGGYVPEQVSPSRGKAIDDIPARLNAGEFIIPKEVVEFYGQKHFFKTIEKMKEEKAELQQRTQAVPSVRPTPQQATPGARREALKVH